MPGIAIVTGASRGIGRAIAHRLAKDDFRVALNDLPSAKEALEGVKSEIIESGGEAAVYYADVSNEDDVQAMVADVVSTMGGVDVMVANAGLCVTKVLIDTKREDFERLFAVNVNGTFFCYKHAAIQMIKQGRGGRIIGASSAAGKQGFSFLSGYSATKFAVRGLTQAAGDQKRIIVRRTKADLTDIAQAAELAPHGITVNAYAPGMVDTSMARLTGGMDALRWRRDEELRLRVEWNQETLSHWQKDPIQRQHKENMPGTAIITGASRGIGRAIAYRLSKDGFRVALNDLPSAKDALEGVRREIAESGGDAGIYHADVSNEADIQAMVADVSRTMGGVDVMVANAGLCTTKVLVDTTREDFERLFAVNVNGTFFCYKHAAIQMIKQGRGGRIIGASSVAGKQGSPFVSGYSATKFAIRGLTQAAAAELVPHGITVNAYAPGVVDTPMGDGLLSGIKAEQERIHTSSDPTANARILTPEDIAGMVSYLASKEARMVTGQSMSINGGMFCD
ncbi:hypothetical protein D9619_008772 [Psilocybe cf. subviscida]|uniref:NAD(P)-binding protein n=1 Tax=Psilocybe cf. subviscida TaxID=2480587 RepID=A0A8H5BA34_9AGAR|nr:hypothetical protein D9619_008772 [Psilocybe cf. subviscida]